MVVKPLLRNWLGHKVLLRMEFGEEQILLTDSGDVWFAAPAKAGWTDLQTLTEKPMHAATVLGEQGFAIGLREIETFLAKAIS
jgi:hypothetical protein